MTKKTKPKRIAPAGRRVSNTELRELGNALDIVARMLNGAQETLIGATATVKRVRDDLRKSRGK